MAREAKISDYTREFRCELREEFLTAASLVEGVNTHIDERVPPNCGVFCWAGMPHIVRLDKPIEEQLKRLRGENIVVDAELWSVNRAEHYLIRRSMEPAPRQRTNGKLIRRFVAKAWPKDSRLHFLDKASAEHASELMERGVVPRGYYPEPPGVRLDIDDGDEDDDDGGFLGGMWGQVDKMFADADAEHSW